MTRYDELLETAKTYRPGQAEAQIRVLARDDRFAAVIGWIEANLEAASQAACAQNIADSHGKLAHAAGSAHALRIVAGQLRTAVEPPKVPVPPADQPDS